MPEENNKITDEEVKWGRRSHLSMLLAYPLLLILLSKGVAFAFPIAMLGAMLVPLYILFTKGGKSKFVATHAKEAIFMQGFMAALGAGVSYLWGGDKVVDGNLPTGSTIMQILSYTSMGIYHFGSIITGSIKASYKSLIKYPLSFFKQPDLEKDRSDFEEQMAELRALENLDKVTASMLKETIAIGKDRVAEIDRLLAKIQDPSVKAKVLEIREQVVKIFENFKNDPEDIKISRQFLSYYLDTTIKIIRKYIDLSSQKVISPELKESLKRVDELLVSIIDAFQKHHDKLIQNDIMDLDAEITVMDKTLKMEGM